MKLVLQIISLCFVAKNCVSTPLVNTSYVRVIRQTNRGCVLPHHPHLGRWNIFEATSDLSPGQIAPVKTVLQVNCDENYKLDGSTTLVCINGDWTERIGKCLLKCSPRYSTPIMKVTCIYNERKLENCDEPVDGTKIKYQCANFYEDLALDRNPVHFCRNGRWSNNIPQCVPICGVKSTKDPTLIVEGRNATKGDFPWQVALYNITNKELLCGGTLLNQRVVLTAAHCITDENGNPYSKEIYMVAIGKYYRTFDHPEDVKNAQFSAIYQMYVPRQYQGDIQNYFGDVAILITKTTFKLSTRALPICVDWGLKHRDTLLDPTRNTNSYVTGWGFTVQHKNPSEVLKELEVPLISDSECMRKLPEDYRKFLTHDKLCAGFLDAGKSVCKGDSGGGLVTRLGTRYYIIAVVSLSPRAPTHEGGCDSQQYALYTKIHNYIDNFILEKEAEFRPDSSTFENVNCEDDPNCRNAASTTTTTTTTTQASVVVTTAPRNTCILPEHPESGRWTVSGSSSLVPGTIVSSNTILQVACNNGYKLTSNAVILCDNGKWSEDIGECLKPCPSLRSTPTTIITCSLKNTVFKDCSNPPDGTIAKHSCAPFYENIQFSKNPVRVCRNGAWDKTRPECVPICGLRPVAAPTLIINGNTVNEGEYPWQVAIYRGNNKQFICGGTLINQKLILTAAHCVSDWKGKPRNKQEYTLAVGKFHREYSDPLDREAQFSELQDIFIPLEYAGTQNNFLGDIAVLVAKQSFVLSRRVQPACVDWGSLYVNATNDIKGYVSGWGLTVPNGKYSDTLQDLEVPIVSRQQCLQTLPEEFQTLLTSDKFCGGYVNRSRSACSGDAGGGLVTKHDGRYYVRGIISTAPALKQGGCDTNQYTLYTQVAKYNPLIAEKDAQIKTLSSPDVETTTAKPTSKPEVQRTTCTLPSHPQNGKWSIYGSLARFSPGKSVVGGTIVQISCDESYKLEGENIILCENGKWSATAGHCLRTCSDVRSSATVKATCIIKNKESANCDNPPDGTRVKYECANFYEDPQLSQNPVHVCRNGKWSHRKPQCVPVCGQKSSTAELLIINGATTKKGDYPWHIGIYRGPQKEFLCSGTLINPRMILTAAHCVTDQAGKARSKALYTISAGKYYRKMDDPREDNSLVQTTALEDIIIPSQYKGLRTNAVNNIAILVTPKPLTLSQRVQPVCIDWASQYEKDISNPANDKTGYVTGWGFTTQNGQSADELQELQVPLINRAKCTSQLPEPFLQFLTYDKLCAGYRNQGKSVCSGDSGGSLVLSFNGRYYAAGILVSAPVNAGGCDTQQYALYTKISSHIDNFILQQSIRYRS